MKLVLKEGKYNTRLRCFNQAVSVKNCWQERKNCFPTFQIETQPLNKIQYLSFSKAVRWKEIFDASSVIHGGLSLRPDPVIEEMVDTLNSKFRTKLTILNSKSKLPNSLKSEIEINQLKSFNKSDENKLRSSNTYYSHNVLGNENI